MISAITAVHADTRDDYGFPGLAARADIGTIIANSLSLSLSVYLRLSHFFSLILPAVLQSFDLLYLLSYSDRFVSVGPPRTGPEDALKGRSEVILN